MLLSRRLLGRAALLLSSLMPAGLGAAQIDFPTAYLERYQQSKAYEVVPGLELAMILVAVGSEEREMRFDPILRDTPYYERVIAHFGPFADHPVFAALALDPQDQRAYTALRNNAYRWRLCDGELCEDEFLGKWWRGEEFDDGFAAQIDLIRDFARISDFAGFFASEDSYYTRLVSLCRERVDLDHMIGWLESNYPYRYDSYRILFSPLMRGNQSTTIKRSENYQQVFAIVDAPREDVDSVNALMRFRWIFTELDHQYVDPSAEPYADRIEEIFGDRAFWTSGAQSDHYRSGFRVFAEYMTWAVFMVYVHESYAAELSERLTPTYVSWMQEKRGFPHFGEFLSAVLRLKEGRQQTLDALTPALLDWAGGWSASQD